MRETTVLIISSPKNKLLSKLKKRKSNGKKKIKKN